MTQETECRFDCTIDLNRERAFSLFVDRTELWWSWPFSGENGSVDAGIDPFAGGSCYETDEEGRRRIWGTVLSIEDPLFVRLAWQVAQDGTEIADPAAASRVMVNFREMADATRLEIAHTEFLRHGEFGEAYLRHMQQPEGWPRIIRNLQEAAKTAVWR
ncbi:SRPBCC domain-containing protein [Roseibium sp.]|uniref:SRPBCC domain-containing protein n=1 Tax=Roseibium sp. TaxID=1936156 RepID=UPI003D13741D